MPMNQLNVESFMKISFLFIGTLLTPLRATILYTMVLVATTMDTTVLNLFTILLQIF